MLNAPRWVANTLISLYSRVEARWPGLTTIAWIFALSRIAFYLAASFAIWVLPADANEPAMLEVNARTGIALHWRWDAIHYYTIAGDGYHSGGPLAFFPLLPLLIRFVAVPLGGFHFHTPMPIGEAETAPLVAGIVIAHVAAFFAFWWLFQLALIETGEREMARRATLYAALFPFAFLYSTPHSEGLFLALSVGAFLQLRRGNWVWSGVLAALASATRPVGILLFPALAVEAYLALRSGRAVEHDRWRVILAPVLAPTGMLLFMLHLWRRTGDPLAYVHVLTEEWGRKSQMPYVTLFDGFRYVFNPVLSPSREVWSIGMLHLVIVLIFIAVIAVTVRSWPISYSVYGIGTLIVVLSSGWGPWTMHGLGRYLMVFFPVYFVMARLGRRRFIDQAFIVTSTTMFAMLTTFYVLWYSI